MGVVRNAMMVMMVMAVLMVMMHSCWVAIAFYSRWADNVIGQCVIPLTDG